MKTLKKNRFLLVLVLTVFALVSAILGVSAFGKKTALAEDAASETFVMEDGVSAKLSNGGGIRFRVKMDEATGASVQSGDATLQIVVAPYYYFDKGGVDFAIKHGQKIDVEKTKIYEENGAYYANGCITDILEANRKLNLQAVAVISSGETTKQTAVNANAKGSVYDVLTSAVLSASGSYEKTIFAMSAYSTWFGTETYPITVLNDTEYAALVAKLAGEEGFNGKFYEVKSGVTAYNAGDFTAVGGNVSKWDGVTLNLDGGTLSGELTEYKRGVGATLPEITKEGFTFGGWYDNADFSGDAVTQISASDEGDKTFYAHWVAETSLTLTDKTQVSLYNNNDFTVDFGDTASEVEGDLASVTVDGVEFTSKTFANGKLTLDTQTLQDKVGLNTIIAKFVKTNSNGAIEKATYVTFTADVATMFISTEAELNNWVNVCYDSNAYKGVYKLANDITCTGVYTNSRFSAWASGKLDFRGTFDGQGYSIINFRPAGDYAGLVGKIDVGGVIKNVSFIGAKASGNGGVITALNFGTIENVYVQVTEFADNSAGGPYHSGATNPYWGRGAAIIANDNDSSTIKNVIVEYACTVSEDAKTGHAVYNNKTDGITINGVYAIGIDRFFSYGEEPTGTEFGAFSSFAAFKAANIDFTSWSQDFWQVINGVVYPRNVAFIAPSLSVNKAMAGETVTVYGSGISGIALSDETAALGVTLSGRSVIIPESVEAGSDLTVIVTDISGKIENLTIKVLGTKTINLDGVIDVQLRNEENFIVDLSSIASEIDGELQSVTVGDTAFTVAAYNGGILTLDSASLVNYLGENTVVARFISESGVITIVNFKVDVVTMLIHNESELNEWLTVAYNAYNGGGLYKLANDITCIGEYQNIAHFTTTWNYSAEFVGTFDGQGYSIINFRPNKSKKDDGTLDNNYSGLVSCIGVGGVVKNVSFLRAKASGNGGIVAALNFGTIENVYVHVTEFVANSGGWGSASATLVNDATANTTVINNVIVDYYCTVPADSANGYPVYKGTNDSGSAKGTFNGLYAIAADKLISVANSVSPVGSYGAYADYAALISAGVNFTASASEFWAFNADGKPYPKHLSGYDFSDPYGLNNKTAATVTFTQGYYNSADASNWYNVVAGNNSFFCTQKFTKETLPVGSIIYIESGWQYRPEGWVNAAKNSTRPDNYKGMYIEVTEEWWGSYTERAFNISKVAGGDISSYADTVSTIFKIYVPNA